MSYIWRAALWPLHHVVSDLMKGIQVVVCVFFFFLKMPIPALMVKKEKITISVYTKQMGKTFN